MSNEVDVFGDGFLLTTKLKHYRRQNALEMQTLAMSLVTLLETDVTLVSGSDQFKYRSDN